MKKAISLQITKIQPQDVASFFAIFLLILVWCCLKSVAYIKTRIEKKKQIKNSMYKEYTKKPALVKLF